MKYSVTVYLDIEAEDEEHAVGIACSATENILKDSPAVSWVDVLSDATEIDGDDDE